MEKPLPARPAAPDLSLHPDSDQLLAVVPGSEAANSDAASLAHYRGQVEKLRRRHLDYPAVVSIETFAKCNAACEFCAYPGLSRKGVRMPRRLFEKIVDDLRRMPRDRPFTISLFRVNEPFLDKRIFGLCDIIRERLPQARVVFFSNGSSLSPTVLEKLARTRNVSRVTVSLNEIDEARHRAVMQLPLGPILQRLDDLHARVARTELSFQVALSRVGDRSPRDLEFYAYCRERYPLFDCWVHPRADWIRLLPESPFEVPDAACSQWFKLHILADGREAFCCIDAEGRFGRGNAAQCNVLGLYAHPERRRMREQAVSRHEVALCARCTALS